MIESSLPAVASRIFVKCKKCATERYHIVLAHMEAATAEDKEPPKNAGTIKLECEVCHSKKRHHTSPKASVPRKIGGAAAVRMAQAVASRKSEHSKEFKELMEANSGDEQKYNMRLKFAESTIIKHPTFGLGIVRFSRADKIEVVFEDQVRLLVHNRGE